MGINFNSSSNYKLLINQTNQLNVSATQSQSSDNVDPVVISTTEGVNPNDVLAYMAGSAVLKGVTTSNNSSKKAVDKELVALQEKANKAKELANNPNIEVKATGAKTLTKEKACTKGRNMGSYAKELTNQYLDGQIKNQAKNAFLAKYTTVLKNAGLSTTQINTTFEKMYSLAKSAVGTMAQSLNNSFVSYGNKGFLNNKGYVNVDTQKLVKVFTQKFNEKVATIAKTTSKNADSALEDYKATKKSANEDAATQAVVNAGSLNSTGSILGQESNLQEMAYKYCADARSAGDWVLNNPNDIAYYKKMIDGKLHTVVCIAHTNPNGSVGVEHLPILGELSDNNISSVLGQINSNAPGAASSVLGQINPNVLGAASKVLAQQSNLQEMRDLGKFNGRFNSVSYDNVINWLKKADAANEITVGDTFTTTAGQNLCIGSITRNADGSIASITIQNW